MQFRWLVLEICPKYRAYVWQKRSLVWYVTDGRAICDCSCVVHQSTENGRGGSLLEILNYLPDGGHFSRVPMWFQNTLHIQVHNLTWCASPKKSTLCQADNTRSEPLLCVGPAHFSFWIQVRVLPTVQKFRPTRQLDNFFSVFLSL